MAAETVGHNLRNELNQLVRAWDQRLRTQQTLVWLPRCLMPGLILGIVLALISRTRPWLLTGQIVQITSVALIASVIAMLVIVWTWPRTNLLAARRFDVLFGLKERVSTALELMAGIIHADETLVARQIEDAWTTARDVNPGNSLPFIWRWQDWAGLLMAAVALTLLLVIPNAQENIIEQNVAQEAVIASAAEEVRQITEDIASDTSLASEDRQQILQSLEASQTVLNEPDVAPEEAFAALSDAAATLEERADDLSQEAAAQQAAMETAASTLRDFTGEAPAEGSPPAASDTLEQLSQDLPAMDTAQQQAAADALDEAANALESSNPDAAQSLRDAADALRSGDTSAAQEAMEQASSQLQNAESAAQSQQQSAQQLSESAAAVRESADQVSRESQQQGQQGEAPPTDQESQSNQSSQSQSGENGEPASQGGESDQASNQPGQVGQPGQSNQAGQGNNQDGQEADFNAGEQPGGQGESVGQGQSPGGEGVVPEGLPSDGFSESGGAGAGDAEGGAGSDVPSGASSAGDIPQTNNPDGQGEGQYDPVYAPQRLGGEGGEEIILDPDASDAPIEQGEFAQNPQGNASVPYNQVFSDYSDAANRALENDYIPLGMRDVVRDYFSSLEPGQGNNRRNGSQP